MAGGTLSVVVPDRGSWLKQRAADPAVRPGNEPPYWADVWPASVAVARWLMRRTDLSGRTVLDLGCGLGVPGTAAGRAGAAVTFADREADALAFACFNAEKAGAARPTACVLDWHQETIAGVFDVIVLADVTYRPVHHQPVLRQLRAALAPHGVCVHAEPFRRESDGFLVLARQNFCTREQTLATFFGVRKAPIRLTFLARQDQVLDDWCPPGPALPDER